MNCSVGSLAVLWGRGPVVAGTEVVDGLHTQVLCNAAYEWHGWWHVEGAPVKLWRLHCARHNGTFLIETWRCGGSQITGSLRDRRAGRGAGGQNSRWSSRGGDEKGLGTCSRFQNQLGAESEAQTCRL